MISKKTSDSINKILRKVVTEDEGTAKLADIHGYFVGGKTGTSQNYKNKNENLNTFISVFPTHKPKYALLVMLENPQVAKNLTYDYKGMKIKASRNEAGWNSVYTAGKIIEKIGPILAINNEDFNNQYVAKKLIKNLPIKEQKIQIKGLAINSQKVKKVLFFLQLEEIEIMVKNILIMQ